VHGTVDSVDTSGRSIYLTNVTGYNNSLAGTGGSGNTLRVYYDDRTSLSYQGRTYRPEDLERGDQVTVHVNDNGNNTLLAQSMDVTYDARGGMASSSLPNYGNGSVVSGTVRSIDTNPRTIELESTSWMNGFQTSTGGNTLIIRYDPTARVSVSGQLYPLSNLERGDVIDVQLQPNGSTNYLAQSITLVRDVRH